MSYIYLLVTHIFYVHVCLTEMDINSAGAGGLIHATVVHKNICAAYTELRGILDVD